MASLASEAKARWHVMRARRDSWLPLWQELGDMFLPGQAYFTRRRIGGERSNENIYDGTPRMAARDLSAALDGLIKPKTSNWFEPTIEDDELAEKDVVKLWLEDAREVMWQAIYHKDARFIQRSSEVDDSLVTFGWGVLWCAENRSRNGIMFRSFHIGSVAVDCDSDGNIDSIAIEEDLTPRQAIARFGKDRLHKEILEEATKEQKGSECRFPFVQMVLPQTDYLAGQIGERGFPFATIVIDLKHEEIISKGGFHEFPAAIPRWETEPGEVYARSPAMVALPDALTLNAISKTLLIGGERAADPPLMVPSDAFLSPIRTFPGGLSVFDVQAISDGGLTQPMFPMPTSSQLPVGRDMQADYRLQVQMAFFKHVLTLPQENIRTATEVVERKEEFIRQLGPIFGRLETDYIGTTVERVFAILERAQAFAPRPPELQGVEVGFRFQSPLQQARKALDVAGLNRAMEIAAPLYNVRPDIFDHIDADQIMRESPAWSGIPSDWLKTEEEVAQEREARAQAQQEAMNVEAAKPVADSLKSIAQAQSIAAEAEAGETGLPV